MCHNFNITDTGVTRIDISNSTTNTWVPIGHSPIGTTPRCATPTTRPCPCIARHQSVTKVFTRECEITPKRKPLAFISCKFHLFYYKKIRKSWKTGGNFDKKSTKSRSMESSMESSGTLGT